MKIENKKNDGLIASNAKKLMVGDRFNTVAKMGLLETDPGRNPVCKYQFSRKTGKTGTMDCLADTSVQYVGAKQVYGDAPSSKRLMFRIAAGTKVILNGAEVELESDIDVAGVMNHVDPNDAYNVQARANEAKKAAKEALRAAVRAKVTENSIPQNAPQLIEKQLEDDSFEAAM